MQTTTIPLPAMYGDHHVTEVRRLLLALPGVADVYASSSFQIVEISYDPGATNVEQLRTALEQAGYIGDLAVPTESGRPATETNGDTYFRHTAAFAQTQETVGFTQTVVAPGRPLWPCPGIGALKMDTDE